MNWLESQLRETSRYDRAQLPAVAQALEGVSRRKVVDVCVAVSTGRAASLGGYEVHAWRVDEAGNAQQRMRVEDVA